MQEQPPGTNAPTLLTLKETAHLLRIAESHVRNLVKGGALPVVRFGDRPGSRLYFDLDDLRRFIEGHKAGKT